MLQLGFADELGAFARQSDRVDAACAVRYNHAPGCLVEIKWRGQRGFQHRRFIGNFDIYSFLFFRRQRSESEHLKSSRCENGT